MFSQMLPAYTLELGDVLRITNPRDLIITMNNDSVFYYLPGLILLVLILAVPLAFLVSIALLRLYHWAVLRSMRTRATATPAQATPPPLAPSPQEHPPVPPLNITVLDSSGTRGGTPANDLYTSFHRAPWRAVAIYSLAGLGFAIVMTSAYLVSARIPILPLRFIALLWIFAWPIVPTINIVAVPTWRMRLMITTGYFLVLILLGIVIVIGNPEFGWGRFEMTWFIINFPAVPILIMFLDRRIRAVSPLVLVITILGLSGAIFTFLFVANNLELFSAFLALNAALGLGRFIVIEVIIIGFTIFGAAGWLVLRWIGSGYKKKKISDQSITIGALWLVYGVVQSIDTMLVDATWFFAGILAFAVFTIMTWTGFKIFPFWRSSDRRHPSLLMLRVFALGRRSEQLFDVIGTYWRYMGSIRLIAGPDLLNTTVEPHEFLDFISGKLARRFIDNSEMFDLRISEMDPNPDPDGRFRVNDFFCHDDTWKMVLTRLITECEVVMMDLRGFSSQNSGCVFEINELINIVPLGQVVFVIDDTTDETFLQQVIQHSWDQMGPASPNRMPTSGSIRLFPLKSSRPDRLQKLLQTLSTAVVPTSQVKSPR